MSALEKDASAVHPQLFREATPGIAPIVGLRLKHAMGLRLDNLPVDLDGARASPRPSSPGQAPEKAS